MSALASTLPCLVGDKYVAADHQREVTADANLTLAFAFRRQGSQERIPMAAF